MSPGGKLAVVLGGVAVAGAAVLFWDDLTGVGAPAPGTPGAAVPMAATGGGTWRGTDDLKARLDLLNAQKEKCSGGKIRRRRCQKRLDKEAKKLLRRGSGGGFSQGAAAFSGVLTSAAGVVGAAYGGGV